MTYRLFEEKHHASLYQKYRLTPPNEVKELVLKYLDKKKGPPYELAVDLGCGTGQNSRLFAPHFQNLVGIDVSMQQVQEARMVPGFDNITYRTGTAEELAFPDGSVDLLTAASAAHWFDVERFLLEASRVLKPHGCMALLGYTENFSLHYGSCGDGLNSIYAEIGDWPRAFAGPVGDWLKPKWLMKCLGSSVNSFRKLAINNNLLFLVSLYHEGQDTRGDQCVK